MAPMDYCDEMDSVEDYSYDNGEWDYYSEYKPEKEPYDQPAEWDNFYDYEPEEEYYSQPVEWKPVNSKRNQYQQPTDNIIISFNKTHERSTNRWPAKTDLVRFNTKGSERQTSHSWWWTQ